MTDITLKVDDGYFIYKTAAIIIYENKLLVVKNENFSYYYPVGGRIKFGETSEEAVIRKTKEETGIDFEIDRLTDQPNPKGIKALCVATGANLYDNLCESGEDAADYHENLAVLFYCGDVAGAYLYLCCMYGLMNETIPEPVQWIASYKPVLSRFIKSFVELQHKYLIEGENCCKMYSVS